MTQKKFSERWVTNLMESIDAHLDEETKISLMESCGRACARESAVGAAERCEGDLTKLLTTLERWIGRGNVQGDVGVVRVVYPTCLCHLVAKGPPRLPDTYCYCSRGWLKEVFETVTGGPVEIELLESIKRGGEQCSFTVRL